MPTEWKRKSWAPSINGWPTFCPVCGRRKEKCDAEARQLGAEMCGGAARREPGDEFMERTRRA